MRASGPGPRTTCRDRPALDWRKEMWAGVVIATPGGYFRATSTFFVNLLPFFFLFFTFFQIENLYIETVILLIILFYPLLCSSSSLSY